MIMKKSFTNRLAAASMMLAGMSMFASNSYADIPDGNTGTPYVERNILLNWDETQPLTIEAEDFDLGGQGVAYKFAQTNAGKTDYRRDVTDVATNNGNDGKVIGNTSTGDWFNYTFEVTDESGDQDGGDFYLDVVCASGGIGKINIYLDGKKACRQVVVKGDGWTNYYTVRVTGLHLTPGKHVLKWEQAAGINVDKLTLTWADYYLATHVFDMRAPGKYSATWYDEQLEEDVPTYSFAHKNGHKKEDGVTYDGGDLRNETNNFRIEPWEELCGISGAGTDENPYRIGNTSGGDYLQYTFTVDQDDDYQFYVWENSAIEKSTFSVDYSTGSGFVQLATEQPGYTGGWSFGDVKEKAVGSAVRFKAGDVVTYKVTITSVDGLNLYFVGMKGANSGFENGIKDVNVEKNNKGDNNWYTISGTRLSAPAKGLMIHNGKKIVVK